MKSTRGGIAMIKSGRVLREERQECLQAARAAREQLLSIKEIAFHMGRSRAYVHGAKTMMEREGQTWFANRYPLVAFLEWIRRANYRITDIYRPGRRATKAGAS